MEGAGALIPVAFDIPSIRPACVLVAAGLGGSTEAAKRFPPETWLLAPTPTMGVYLTTPDELDLLVLRVKLGQGERYPL